MQVLTVNLEYTDDLSPRASRQILKINGLSPDSERPLDLRRCVLIEKESLRDADHGRSFRGFLLSSSPGGFDRTDPS